MRLARIGLLAGLLFALSGCGASKQQTASDAAKIVPATAPAFVSIDSDLSSSQWQQVDKLMQKFPGRSELLSSLRSEVRSETSLDWDRDVEPALGDEIDLVWLDLAKGGSNAVALTKPKDDAKFKALIEKGNESDDSSSDLVVDEVDGWTVISDSQAKIDRFESQSGSGEKLADDAKFKEAMGELPDDALATVYAKGQSFAGVLAGLEGIGGAKSRSQELPEFVAAGLAAEDDGLRLVGTTKPAESTSAQAEAFASSFVDEVPADAIVFLTFKGSAQLEQLETEPAYRQALQELQKQLGLDLVPLLGLLKDEVAIYVRPQAPIPEITLLLKTGDEANAITVVDGLMRRLSPKIRPTEQDGVKMTAADFGEYTIFYGTFDGKLVVTSGDDAVAKLREGGSKLSDSKAFEDAKSAAGAPDETSGFAYLDLEEGIPLVERFVQASGEPVPPMVRENLEPLKSLLLWSDAGGSTQKASVFLRID